MKTATLKMLVYSTVAAASVALAFTTLRADSLTCDLSQYKSGSGLDRSDGTERADRVMARPERLGDADAVRDRWRPTDRPRSVSAQDGRPVGDARAEPRARLSRRQRHPPDVDAAGGSAEGRRRRTHARGDCQESLVRVLGCAARDEARPRDHRAAARPQSDIKQATASFQHLVVPRQDRWRRARGDVPGTVDGHLLGRPAVHRLSRHQPASHGCARDDERRMDRLQIRGGPERIFHRPDAARRLARHRRPAAAVRVRRRRPTRRSRRSRRRTACWSRKAKARRSRRSRRRTRSSSRAKSTPIWDTSGTGRIRRRPSASASARRTREEAPQYVDNFALFNAPPGTVQRMGVYFYASPDAGEGTRQAVLRFTHGDEFKPLPGYKTFVNHFHLRFTDRVRASGSFDTPMQDLMAMKALGLNIIGLSDFHGDLHPNDPGPLRFKDQKDYFEATRRASDRGFPRHAMGGAERLLRRALQHHVPEAERLLVQGAPAGTAVHRDRPDLRQGLPHRQCGRRAADDGRGRRVLVSRASAHQRHDRVSRL